jgi:Ca2+:H+ antiporter
MADEAVLKLSRGTSVVLLLTYLLYLAFQLKSHSYLYKGTPQHVIDAQTEPGIGPGILARMNSSSSSSTSSSSASSATGSHRRVKKRLRISKLGKSRTKDTPPSDQTAGDEGSWQDIETKKGKETANEPASPQPPAKSPTDPPASRPQMGLNRLSFRPVAPPVFRSSTQNPNEHDNRRTYSDYPIRRLRSDPRQWHSDNVTNSPTRMSTEEKPTDPSKPPEEDEPELTQFASIILLLCSTGLVALCAEFMVGSIEHLVENSPISEAFIGLIILPIVGNAAEHVTAVTVAAKNKLDLSLGVSLGSSIQIALFVTPLVVILGWILDKEMSLYFNLFETVTIFVSTFVVNFLVLDGRSNYLEGALLCACYVIIAVGAYLFPDSENQNAGTAGPGDG